jgi:hypothetical protein
VGETSDRAFVLFVNAVAAGDSARGRIEHVPSGLSRPFVSKEEAWRFIREVLEDEDRELEVADP